MRTITLELLRHGPAHNQLLSPLTPYLALCEAHEAVTLQVKLEHRSLLHQLRALSYQLGEETRQHQVQDSARFLAELLAQVPGLAAEVNRTADGAGPVHLRLVLSASELALLPFELALAPATWPGAGQPLLLQPQQAVCITRESRRVSGPAPRWPRQTRVLVVLASPAGLPAVPDLAHLVALRGCLAPWIGNAASLDQHLTVLTDASLLDVQRACARTDFSHVHILAHGGERNDGADTRYGLMLHAAADPGGPADIVSGERLASALRPVRQAGLDNTRAGEAHCPAVVTLASCNSGAGGGVTSLGASIAHALHEAGIPVVIASQFPLSFGGSVRMVQSLYTGLLWGDDPRTLLVSLRRQLHAEFGDTADWASLTAYAALPPRFEEVLAEAQIQRAMAAINLGMDVAEAALPGADASMADGLARVAQGWHRLQALPAGAPGQHLRVQKLLASTAKREAELSHAQAGRAAHHAARAGHLAAMWQKVAASRQHYFTCWGLERTPYFCTQYLSLGVLLALGGQASSAEPQPGRDPLGLWAGAEVQAQHEWQQGGAQDQQWALGTLIELCLIAPALGITPRGGRSWAQQALSHTERLLDAVPPGSFVLLSTRRQMQRYLDWYAPLRQAPADWLPGLCAAAQGIVDRLPLVERAAWDYSTG